jgi:transposase
LVLTESWRMPLMPAPIPIPVRQAIFQRWQKGESVASLAKDFQLCERTVRHLVRRFVERGQSGVIPDYARCATKTAPTDGATFQKVVQMRQQHPTWGAGLIRVFLRQELEVSPSERTLQRWLQRAALSPAPPGRRPTRDEHRARRPHQVWQMDAAEQIRLASDQWASWLRLVDECSGAVLQTTVFPPAVLELGGTRSRATGVARGFFPMGAARGVPGRQRRTLGIGRRLAHRLGAVVDRLGCGDDLESTSATSRQWRGRTVARHGQTLGRAQDLL